MLSFRFGFLFDFKAQANREAGAKRSNDCSRGAAKDL
jgi:hypothetical protein